MSSPNRNPSEIIEELISHTAKIAAHLTTISEYAAKCQHFIETGKKHLLGDYKAEIRKQNDEYFNLLAQQGQLEKELEAARLELLERQTNELSETA